MFWECREKVATQVLQNGVEEAPTVPNPEVISTVEDWMQRIVVPYTKCDLTFTKDKLPALDGIAKVLQPRMRSNYHAGLWTNNMKAQLCWQPRKRVVRPPYRGAPSWSWASVDGPISFWSCSHTTKKTSTRSTFQTAVYNIVSEPAHSNAFGELATGHVYIRCSRLVVGYYQAGQQQGDHNISISYAKNDARVYIDSFRFVPDSISNDMSSDHGVDSAHSQHTVAGSGPLLAMVPLEVEKSLYSFQNNKEDWIHSKSIFGLILRPFGTRLGEYTRVGSFECSSVHGIGHDLVQEKDDCTRFERLVKISGEAMARSACAETLTDAEYQDAPYQIILV
jgi:hypothetical protein